MQTDKKPSGGEPRAAATVSDTLTDARCKSPERSAAEPLLQELIQHFAMKTDFIYYWP